jgi:hypothetical protein
MLEYEVVKKADLPPAGKQTKRVDDGEWRAWAKTMAMLPLGDCTRVSLEGMEYTSTVSSVHCAATAAGFRVSTAKRDGWLWVFRGASVPPAPEAKRRPCIICSTEFHHRNPRAKLCGGRDCLRKYNVRRATAWRSRNSGKSAKAN